jgi:Signal peptidase, peptidase S26
MPMLMILAAVLSVAFQAQPAAVTYVRGDIVELVRAPGESALPHVRVIAVPGDRLQADVRSIRVNEQSVEGVSRQLLEQFAEPWDQVVPSGHYFVIADTQTATGSVSSAVRFHGLVPAGKIVRKATR